MPPSPASLFIGLMSGTSLDGIDCVLASISRDNPLHPPVISTLASSHLAFPEALRAELFALQASCADEIHREALAANALAQCYAACVAEVLQKTAHGAPAIRALGVHGQTIRHRPELGYTRQLNNPALLAELTSIDVIADFRSRDIAASGQGAPLVPAFHQAVFGCSDECRVVANIGGIANISVVGSHAEIIGFDTGPGNVLMDMWADRHLGKPYDENGRWAATGRVIPQLLAALRDDPFFMLAPPKSTGRDLFRADWLQSKLEHFPDAKPADVQATLAALTATTLADAITTHARTATAVYICGGGAYNAHLLQVLQSSLEERSHPAVVRTSDVLGVAPNHVEALAFAWLAHRFCDREPGNLPSVTGARGPRVLGALYPA